MDTATRWNIIGAILISLLVLSADTLAAASTKDNCALALPATEKWLPQEVWAWNKICQGQAADFLQYKDGHGCVSTEAEKWPQSSHLRAKFIETLVRNPRYRDTLRDSGIQIYCAKIEDQLNLSNLKLEYPLTLSEMWLKNGANLTDLETSSKIDMQKTRSDGFFDARNMKIDNDLLMNSTQFIGIDIANSIVKNNISFESAKIKNELNAERIKVSGYLWLNNGEFNTINIVSAKIGSGLILTGSKLTGELNGWFTQVENGPAYCLNAEFNKVNLQFAKFSSLLDFSDSTIKGFFNANRLTVNGDLMLKNVTFSDEVDISFAEITHDLALSGMKIEKEFNGDAINVHGAIGMRDANFKDLFMISARIGGYMIVSGCQIDGEFDLSNATIKEILNIGSSQEPANTWGKEAKFSLHSASVGSLQDTATSWELTEGNLDLNGFAYATAGAYGSGTGDTIAERPIDWLMSWLAKHKDYKTHFNPQPFDQLSKVLHQTGRPSKAIDVLHEKHNRQRFSPETPITTKIWLTINWALIGYGYKEWRALIWLASLIVIGIIMLSRSTEGKNYSLMQRIIFSFDIAIPIIHFNSDRTDEILKKLDIATEVYFHVHKILGFIFVTFMAAGLSGLVH